MNRNVCPALTLAPAPVATLGLLSCRALAPTSLFPDAFASPSRSSPLCSLLPWNFPLRLCPAAILPTRGSSLLPRRRAAGRASPPRDRPPAVATARSDRPPRPHSFASMACDGPRRRPQRTPAVSAARDPAAISRPSTAAAAAGMNANSRPAGRGRRPSAASASPRLPSSLAAHPGPQAATSGIPRPRLQGRTLRSAFPTRRGGTSRALAVMTTSEQSQPLVGVVVSLPCMSCRKTMRRGETETRENRATRPCGRTHLRRRSELTANVVSSTNLARVYLL